MIPNSNNSVPNHKYVKNWFYIFIKKSTNDYQLDFFFFFLPQSGFDVGSQLPD